MWGDQHELKKIVENIVKYWFYLTLFGLGLFEGEVTWEGCQNEPTFRFKNNDMKLNIAEKQVNSKDL